MYSLTNQHERIQPAIALLPFFNGSAEEGRKRFSPFFDVGPVADLTNELPYDDMNSLQVRQPHVPLMASLTARQNPMATHGDRKIMRAAAIASIDEDILTWVFQEYCKLVAEHPEAKRYGQLCAFVELP